MTLVTLSRQLLETKPEVWEALTDHLRKEGRVLDIQRVGQHCREGQLRPAQKKHVGGICSSAMAAVATLTEPVDEAGLKPPASIGVPVVNC